MSLRTVYLAAYNALCSAGWAVVLGMLALEFQAAGCVGLLSSLVQGPCECIWLLSGASTQEWPWVG